MSDDKRRRPAYLRLVDGGLQRESRLHGVVVVAAPEGEPPFPLEAVAVEEDTFLVLSADTEVRDPLEHPLKLMTAVLAAEPVAPGTVVVGRGHPLRLLAVVHDLNQDPSWREEWIVEALNQVLYYVERLHLRSLGMQVLGAVHGRLKPERFIELLRAALETPSRCTLERIWLMTANAAVAEGLEGLLQE